MDSKTCFNYGGFQKDDASNIKAKLHIYDEEFNEGNNAQITIRNLYFRNKSVNCESSW